MKTIYLITLMMLVAVAHAQDRQNNTVILDDASIKNLGIKTKEVEEGVFETTAFTLGEIEHTCESHGILASRIPGRLVEVKAHQGDFVTKGEVMALIESRQPGNPPPVIELEAPQSGLIIKSSAHLGAPVEPSEELMIIHDLSTVWAVAKVPQYEASILRKDQLARIIVPAIGEDAFEAKFLQLGTEADAVKGYIEAIFVIPNPENRLRPGMRAEIYIVADSREGVTSVPREAVQGEGGDRFVFIKDFELENAFVRVPVTVGETNETHVEILSGLFPGDEIVVKGAYELAFAGGGKVSLKEALDAAHGHPHNEDGTEMTKEQLAAMDDGHSDHSHDHENHGPLTMFLSIACGVLLLLLIVSQFALHAARKSKA